MPFREAKGRCYSYPLVDLEVLRPDGSHLVVDWYQKAPFDTSGSPRVYIEGISPSLVLSSPHEEEVVEISDLEAGLLGRVNKVLQNEGVIDAETGSYRAPIASLVWEAVFASKKFWPDKG